MKDQPASICQEPRPSLLRRMYPAYVLIVLLFLAVGYGRLFRVDGFPEKVAPAVPSGEPAGARHSFAEAAAGRAPALPPAKEPEGLPSSPEPAEVHPQTMENLPAAEKTSLQGAIHTAIHAVEPLTPAEKELPGNKGVSHFATNPSQKFHARFLADGGVSLASGLEGKTWRGTLRVADASYRPDPQGSDATGWRTTVEQRTRAERDLGGGLTEWYENRAGGLEHGFTLLARPGLAEDTQFSLDVALEGLRAEADPTANGTAESSHDLVFIEPETNQPVLAYRHLKVWDAGGRELAANMRATGTGLRFSIRDEGAVYPVTIDPLIVSLEQPIEEPKSNISTLLTPVPTADSPNYYTGGAVAVDGSTMVIGSRAEAAGFAVSWNTAYVFVRDNQGNWSQQARLKASNAEDVDHFGHSVAISGNTIVVGAPYEGSSASGVNGDQNNNDSWGSGAAYVFVRQGNTWSQQAYLKPRERTRPDDIGQLFGSSVAIDGDTIVAGSPQAIHFVWTDNRRCGEISIFSRTGSNWELSKTVREYQFDNELILNLGYSVAISGDTILAGAPRSVWANRPFGAVLVYSRDSNGDWKRDGDKTGWGGFGQTLGESLAISGDAYVVGGSDQDLKGFVKVYFKYPGETGHTSQILTAPHSEARDGFGFSVAISGRSIVVGAPGEDSNATGINGNQTNNAAVDSGAVYLFRKVNTEWNLTSYLKAPNTRAGHMLGYSVAASGNMLLAGAPIDDTAGNNVGGVHMFHTGGAASDDHFGRAVDLDGNTAVVGAMNHDHLGMNSTGKAWIFRRSGSTWNLEAGLIDDLAEPGDRFGSAVSVSGDWVAVGADGDDAEGGLVTDCGSVQVFSRSSNGTWSRLGKLFPERDGARLGRSVSLDGRQLVAGAPGAENGSGRVRTWYGYPDQAGNQIWENTGVLSAEVPQDGAAFGFSVAVSGNHLIVGEPARDSTLLGTTRRDSGAVTFFRKRYTDETGPIGTWTHSRINTFNYLGANGGVGFSVAINGSTAVTGNANPPGGFSVTGTSHVGAAWPYTYNGSIWVQGAALNAAGFAEGAYFGSGVAVENGVIAVGAFGNGILHGAVRLFRQEEGAWVKQQDISQPFGAFENDSSFGGSVALSQGRLLVGAHEADTHQEFYDAGRAFIYTVTDPAAVRPVLSITRNGSNVVLTWPAGTGLALWQSSSLSAGSWTKVSGSESQTTRSFPISSAPRMFFRLAPP